MNLFKIYSTSKNNNKNSDLIIDLDKTEFQAIRAFYDNDDDQYVINIDLVNGHLCELHDDQALAVVRIKEILVAFGARADEAQQFAYEMRFLRK